MKSQPLPRSAATPLGQEREAVDLAQLVKSELPRVERLLGRMLGPRADLEDLVQTVFLEVCRALPRYRGDSTLSTFVGGITVRVARRTMRPLAFLRFRADLHDDLASNVRDPEAQALEQATMARVRRALERIAPAKRIAFCLWALEGLEPAEIAALTHASLAATRSRIFYAQKELRALAARDPLLREALPKEHP